MYKIFKYEKEFHIYADNYYKNYHWQNMENVGQPRIFRGGSPEKSFWALTEGGLGGQVFSKKVFGGSPRSPCREKPVSSASGDLEDNEGTCYMFTKL